jgi:hypothetical protein
LFKILIKMGFQLLILAIIVNVMGLSQQNSLTFYYENTLSPNRSDCMNSLNSIVADITALANEFYLFANGKYLNQFGDYATCTKTTTKG